MPILFKNRKLIVLTAAALLTGGAIAAEPRGGHHHAFAKDVDAFHAVLAPLWHARPGKERSLQVCAKAKQLEKLAGDIRTSDSQALAAAAGALTKQCQSGPNGIDAALFDVHEAFHHLAEPKGK